MCIRDRQTLVFHATVRGFCWWSSLPISACIQAGLDGGREYFLIEQDDTYGRDLYESLKISHDNLVRMGYACLLYTSVYVVGGVF